MSYCMYKLYFSARDVFPVLRMWRTITNKYQETQADSVPGFILPDVFTNVRIGRGNIYYVFFGIFYVVLSLSLSFCASEK